MPKTGGIARLATIDGELGGITDALRGIKIWLAHGELTTSRPWAFKSRAFWVTAMVAEGLTRERAWARNDMSRAFTVIWARGIIKKDAPQPRRTR